MRLGLLILSLVLSSTSLVYSADYQFQIEKAKRRLKIIQVSKEKRFLKLPDLGLHPNVEDWQVIQVCNEIALVAADDVQHKLFLIDASVSKPELRPLHYPG